MRRRVKITGLGPVTPAGIGRDAFFKGINESVSRARMIDRFEQQAGKVVAAEVKDFQLSDWVPDTGRSKKLPRQTQFAMAATMLALKDAGLSVEDFAGMEPVVINGSSMTDMNILQQTFVGVATKGPRHALPSAVYEAPPSAVAGRIAGLLQTRCRVLALQSACCAGMDAIGHGARMVADGETDIAVCCGTEAPIYATPMAELAMVKLSPRNTTEPSQMGRPFDLWRNTGIIGEGACAVILEPEDSLRPAYAWLSGYAYGGDADELAASGLAYTMKMALANAARRAEDVDLIHTWGSGHADLDRTEALCLREMFKSRLPRIPAVSIKGAIGNALAAAGAIQVASAALALKTGMVPPTVNWETPDPECPLNLSRSARELSCEVVLINTHGACGTNASMVLLRA
jgi:3-oxoacyl-[acyl-carrier-protein] synthase II